MNAIEFEDFEPGVKGELVKKRLADGWMIIHAYTVKMLINRTPTEIYSEQLVVAMGKPKPVQKYLAVEAPLQD